MIQKHIIFTIILLVPIVLKSQDYCELIQEIQEYQDSVKFISSGELNIIDSTTFNIHDYLSFFNKIEVEREIRIGVCFFNNFYNGRQTTINSDYYITLLKYSRHFIRSLGDIDRTNIEEISFYDFLDSLEQNFNKSIICSNYFPLISIYQNNYIIPLIIEKYMGEAIRDHKRDSLLLEELSGHSEKDLLNQFVLSNQYNQFLTNHFSELFEENKNFIENTIKEPFLLKTLADRYSFVKDYMTNPASLSDAMLGETDFINESIYFSDNSPIRKNLLKSLINSNKNKVIYLDFWAEWCPACIPELIESKKLQTKYKEKDIEFIYICLSDSTKAKEKIKEIEIGGKHYYLNPNESRYFQKTLGFWGVVSFT